MTAENPKPFDVDDAKRELLDSLRAAAKGWPDEHLKAFLQVVRQAQGEVESRMPKAKATFRPTSLQIADILPHVRYEIAQALILPTPAAAEPHIRESVYLAMLMHARLLLDFFEHEPSRGRRDKDVYCFDFDFTPRRVEVSEEDRDRLNRDIAHLTYHRLRHDDESRDWPLLVILNHVRARADEFISHIISKPPSVSEPAEIELWKMLPDKITESIGRIESIASRVLPPAPPNSPVFVSGGNQCTDSLGGSPGKSSHNTALG
jgi:hypothetical protein